MSIEEIALCHIICWDRHMLDFYACE